MEKNKEGTIAVFVVVIVIIVLSVTAFLFLPVFLQKQNTPSEKEQTHQGITYAKGDINQDGKVDALDEVLIKNNIHCQSTDACWEKVIEHTVSGYNPIYVKDLDINKDNIIDENDVTAMQK
jgi:hypothetical protein